MKKLLFLVAGVFCLVVIAVSATPAISETTVSETDAPPLASEAAVTIIDAQICEDVIEHEPVSSGNVFTGEISKLYCYSKIKSSEETEIRHLWSFNDTVVAETPLLIGISSGWRTFSSKNIRPIDKGNWKVEIVDTNGAIIETLEFVVN